MLIPDIAQKVADEALRLELAHNDRVRAELVERSEAMLDIIAAISAHYERSKRARSLLDFDDLVERLGMLLDNENGTVTEWPEPDRPLPVAAE